MITLAEERDADVIARSVQPGRFHVLIAGAGPAGVEAALRLQRIAGDRIRTTIVTPDERLVHLPPTVLDPFAAGRADAPPLGALAASAGARLHRGTVVSVDRLAREVRLRAGDTLRYDALLIAVGGRQRSPYPRALAFGTPGSEERMHGVIQDLEGGYIRRIAFVVPPGASWPLPLYELALMTAERAFEMCVGVEVTLVTPEPFALALFGEDISQDVARLLAAADITVRPNTVTEMPRRNVLEAPPFGRARGGRSGRDRAGSHGAGDRRAPVQRHGLLARGRARSRGGGAGGLCRGRRDGFRDQAGRYRVPAG